MNDQEWAANAARLDACAGPHDFERHRDGGTLARLGLWRCALCDGETDSKGRHWYETGRTHGRAEAIGEFRIGVGGGEP